MTFGPLPISKLRRTWSVVDGELTGPEWEMTFHKKGPHTDGVPVLAAVAVD